MAEWLMRGTVNTFFRGSIPLDTLNLKTKKVKFIEAVAPAPPSEGGWRSPAARQTACLSGSATLPEGGGTAAFINK